MRFFILITLSLALVCVSAVGEEFSWSWDETLDSAKPEAKAGDKKAESAGQKVEQAAPAEAAALPSASDQQQEVEPAGKNSFKWSWEEDEEPLKAAEGKVDNIEPAGPVAGVPEVKTGVETVPAVESAPPVVEKPRVEAKTKPPVTPAKPAVVKPVAAEKQPGPEIKVETVSRKPAVPAARPPAGEKKVAAGRIDASEYNDLLKENLELRKKIDDAMQDKDAMSKENQNLSKQVQELAGKIEEAVAKIKDIRKEQGAGREGTARAAELEGKLSRAEAEKNRLAGDLSAMQKKLAEIEAVDKGGRAPATARPGSDLVRDLEKENAMLKDKLSRLDANRDGVVNVQGGTAKRLDSARQEVQLTTVSDMDMRDRLVEARAADLENKEKERELKDRLAEARGAEKENKKKLAALLNKVPNMEKEIDRMKAALAEKDANLRAHNNDVVELKEEIQNRDRRLKKVEKISEMIDKARSDVGKISSIEKRDMHYNMAVVYAKEGKQHEAETEYLHALRIDPTDADVHYNLAILYDSELHNRAKAAMHYRAYLKLNPYAKDADAVKSWLMELDMGK